MGGFNMQVDLTGASEAEVTERRADAFEAAFRHAVSDPSFRLQMIMGETYRAYRDVLFGLTLKLEKEKPEVRELASRAIADPKIIFRLVEGREDVAALQQRLLEEAYPEAEEQKCLPQP